MSRSRITYILPHLETGGTQRQMKELLLGLDRDRFEPRVVAFSGFGSDNRTEIEATDTPVTLLLKRKGGDPLIVFRLLVTGDGIQRDALEEQARQLGLQRQVRFLAPVRTLLKSWAPWT